ncbi:MAG TPA: hypothetical protein VFH45_06280 [Acidimicrobiales bacterium]|nr:hypothetical protein [Acidimicrobiales bacterium]
MDPDDFDAELAWQAVLEEAIEIEATVWDGEPSEPVADLPPDALDIEPLD